ncbi:uncharacterized protein VTP21DRAFT_10108 [Calcarisporiella thermophila]|uniref:uncharacterized protein n=1 Tax=Calcarisporiella thermophila TaxID=911321 RepID=UPI0037449C66
MAVAPSPAYRLSAPPVPSSPQFLLRLLSRGLGWGHRKSGYLMRLVIRRSYLEALSSASGALEAAYWMK